jgi:energy-coupling factor transport system ATP-binding protein
VERHGRVALVPQDPSSLLFSPTVRDEVAETCRLVGAGADAVDEWLARLDLTALADRHPRSLSTGERQRVAVAAVAVGGAPVLLHDEPTRGIDALSRAALEAAARDHATSGGAVVIATHDVELAARTATRVVALGGGEVVADGPARTVLAGSLFAPQVLRVLPPHLTVADVAASLPVAAGDGEDPR